MNRLEIYAAKEAMKNMNDAFNELSSQSDNIDDLEMFIGNECNGEVTIEEAKILIGNLHDAWMKAKDLSYEASKIQLMILDNGRS